MNFRQYIKILHLSWFALGLVSAVAQAQVGRKPANFVPDDDMIVVPMVVEKNFMDEFHEKHRNDFKNARQKLEFWISQEAYAKSYGLENTGVVKLPTEAEKRQFLERNYLRFLGKDVEKNTNEELKNWWEDWNSDDELAAIEGNEDREEFIVKAKKSNGQRTYDQKKEVKIGKSKVRFDIQPRLEIGMVKIQFYSPYFKARAWVGINGNQEIKLERKFKSTKTNAQVNYFIERGRVLASIDQPIVKHLSLRLTHDRFVEHTETFGDSGQSENNIIQLRFGMGF